jgi:glucokinase
LSPINLVEAFHAEGLNPSKLLHDTECLAIGEARYGALKDDPDIISGEEEFALVYADEGVGTTLFINGKPHNGAGCAGRIGRLVVAPDGPYNRTFACRGPLELFASRPSVSTNIVGEYLAEQGKSGESSAGDRAFRAAVGVAAQGDWSELSFEQIAQGVESRDPLAVTVIEEASQYLGLAIHSVLTVVHPPAIVLGGGMLERIPTFADSVTSHARRFSYPLAWNQTTIRLAKLGREAQGLGAAELLIRSLGHQNDRLEVVPH